MEWQRDNLFRFQIVGIKKKKNKIYNELWNSFLFGKNVTLYTNKFDLIFCLSHPSSDEFPHVNVF